MIGTNHDANRSDPIRRKIEMLGTSLSLPTVRRAMGILEGEHASARRGGNDDLLDIRAYEVGDEARQIDWKISARNGRAMIAQREHPCVPVAGRRRGDDRGVPFGRDGVSHRSECLVHVRGAEPATQR